MRWAGHVADTGDIRNAYKILVRKPEGKIHSEDLSIDGRILLKQIFRKIHLQGVCFIHLAQVAGSCVEGKDPSGSIKGREFLV
jgi:hypothetical protein